jgi:hypothetical protein
LLRSSSLSPSVRYRNTMKDTMSNIETWKWTNQEFGSFVLLLCDRQGLELRLDFSEEPELTFSLLLDLQSKCE